MSDDPKKDPLEARWQPVAVVSLGEEKCNAARSPIATVLEIGSIVLLLPYWGLRTAFLLACCLALFSIALWIALRLRNSRPNREKP
jgi:hypothetical protein